MTHRINHSSRTPRLLALLFAGCASLAQAAPMSAIETDDQCKHKPCAAPETPSAGNYVFGAIGKDLGGLLKDAAPALPDLAWNEQSASHNKTLRSHGAAEGLLGQKPDVIHTGSGKDVVPGQKVLPDPQAPGYPPAPTAVPLPAALWLFLSGIVALGGGARRRSRR